MINLDELKKAVEQEDYKFLALRLLELSYRKVELENAYRKILLQNLDFQDRRALDKQELELLQKDPEALVVKEELEMVSEMLRALKTALAILKTNNFKEVVP